MWPKPIVWPSGSARMMSSFEMTPFAPGRLSTMTCRPRPAVILGAIMRATRSVAPPGGKPTIMRTGLDGAHSARRRAGRRGSDDALQQRARARAHALESADGPRRRRVLRCDVACRIIPASRRRP